MAKGEQAGFATLGSQTLVGRSPAFLEVVRHAHALADEGFAGALLNGEAGTGKELLARGMHYAGPLAHHPFLSFNASSVPDHLVGPELLGSHPSLLPAAPPPRRGLLELAGGGTVFVDEVTRVPHALQARLAEAVARGAVARVGSDTPVPVSCRLVLSTTVPLPLALARGDLHPRLYEAVGAARLTLPPLRDREGDVELLAQYFLHLAAGEHGLAIKRLDEAAIAVLVQHLWPGNVRELKHVVERAATVSEGPVILPEHLVVQHRTALSGASQQAAAAEIRIPGTGKTLDDIEREAVVLTLKLTAGNHSAAARLLGISRPTLLRKLRQAAPPRPPRTGWTTL